ncbi:MAG: hypothetical protein H0X12_11175 [Nocardioides sp.]|nr:hypothetical protein [Nocardioides sp.]
MVSKTSEHGRPYDIDGRVLIWHPEDDEGARGNVPDVRIPLRIKMKLVLSMGEKEIDNTVMAEMVRAIVPNQGDVINEMDVNDFQDMFTTWQSEYNTLTGGSLGESLPQPGSLQSTVEPSSTTSAPVSA